MKTKLSLSSLMLLFFVLLSCEGNDPGDQLVKAAGEGDINQIKTLLEQGVDINYQGSGFLSLQETPCMKAAEKGQLETLKFLIEQGADLKKGHSGGENPISYAGKNGHFDIVFYLIEQGEDVNYQESNYGMTPVLYAAEHGDYKALKKLIKKGADTKVRNKKLHTLLSIAAYNKNIETVKYLLKIGMDPNEPGMYHWSVLTNAIFTTDYMDYSIPDDIKQLVDILLAAGADINQQDADGNTVLIHAAQQKAHTLCNYLIKRGADPNIRNNGGGDYLDVLNLNE